VEGRTHRPELVEGRCGACGVCTGACPAAVAQDLARETHTLRGVLSTESITLRDAGIPPCRLACPLSQDIQGYLGRVAAGDPAGALKVILRDNPLPSVLGHICHHPCQDACIHPVTAAKPRVRDLKRFAATLRRPEPKPAPVSDRARAAVVGSGPAGLAAAWHLARNGVSVTVFEAKPVAGGMLSWAIPEFRLPRRAVETDLAYVLAHGVTLNLNARVTAEELARLQQAFDRVILACGAPRSKAAELEGADLDRVWLGLDFLSRAALGPLPEIRTPVVVVGGGNVALDAARWCLRQKVRTVLVYRRDPEQMPAYAEEVAAARVEGLEMTFRMQPLKVRAARQGPGLTLVCGKTQPGQPGPDGRVIFEPVAGSEEILEAGTVILALGQETEAPAWARALGLDGLAPGEKGRLTQGVYAAGDLVTGPSTVVEAMAAGVDCARAIIEELPS
jgi:NADPH-dependent glutamate synthase beta subunit-like oxidoreductase